MLIKTVCAVSLIVSLPFASPVLAHNDTAPPEEAQAVEEESERTCKRVIINGQRFKYPVCGTEEQWREFLKRGRYGHKNTQFRGLYPGEGARLAQY